MFEFWFWKVLLPITDANSFNSDATILQGIDGSTRKTALLLDTDYMVKKTILHYIWALLVFI